MQLCQGLHLRYLTDRIVGHITVNPAVHRLPFCSQSQPDYALRIMVETVPAQFPADIIHRDEQGCKDYRKSCKIDKPQ